MNSLLKTSVSVKILAVGSWVITLPREPTASQRLTNANSLKSVDFLGGNIITDNIVGGVRPHGTTHIHKKSLQSSMTKEKQIPSFCQGHVQSNGSKILSQGIYP